MKYEPHPGWWSWWDTGPYPMHRSDGTRCRHRINYDRIPIVEEFRDIPGIFSNNPAVRLKARKKLWRRLRHGYYDRHYLKHIPPPPTQWDKHGNKVEEPQSRPRCRARCKDGHRCRARAVVNKHTGKPARRCKWHGGHSTGPRTEAGKALSLAALARGRLKRSGHVPM